eukprot:6208047-Pleurochrysis_carterae.AAC.1
MLPPKNFLRMSDKSFAATYPEYPVALLESCAQSAATYLQTPLPIIPPPFNRECCIIASPRRSVALTTCSILFISRHHSATLRILWLLFSIFRQTAYVPIANVLNTSDLVEHACARAYLTEMRLSACMLTALCVYTTLADADAGLATPALGRC